MRAVRDAIAEHWLLHNEYFKGQVSAIHDSLHTVLYNYGDVELLDLSFERWQFYNAPLASPMISSDVSKVLLAMMDHFGNRTFMRHEAQAFPSYVMTTPYHIEETEFKRTCKTVALHDVPPQANIISSQVLYELKVLDDRTLKLKACIAPHGNEDS